MARRSRGRWALAAGVVAALWFAVTAVAGATGSNGGPAAVGFVIIGLYIAQVVLCFSAPAPKSAVSGRARRARWLWLSVVPLLGSWLPALAGLRARVWWWVLLGVACEGIVIDATIQMANSNDQSPAEAAKLSALLLVGWLGGVVVSMLIRPVYERRVLGTVIKRPWPVPTERAQAIGARYGLRLCVAAIVLIGVIVEAEKRSKNDAVLGAVNIVVETLMMVLLVPLIRSRRLRPRDLGIRRTLPVPAAGYAVLALVGYLVAISVWVVVVPQTTGQAAHRLTAVTHHPGAFAAVLIVVALAVFAPVCEEVFFRGMLYRSLRNHLPLWPAVLIAGSLFGLIHIFAYPLNTIPVKIVFGILMCLLYERTGSVLPGIAVHSFVDGTAADVAVTGNAYVALVVYGVLLLVVLALHARRHPVSIPPGSVPSDLPATGSVT